MPHLSKKLKLEYQQYSLYDLNDAFIEACKKNNISIVKYLLTSPDLATRVNIHVYNDEGLRIACEHRCYKVIEYLLLSPDLHEHANVHLKNDIIYSFFCEISDYRILKILFQLKGKNRILFQEREENIDWAMRFRRDELVCLMFCALCEYDPLEYFAYYNIVQNYCQENDLNFEEWLTLTGHKMSEEYNEETLIL